MCNAHSFCTKVFNFKDLNDLPPVTSIYAHSGEFNLFTNEENPTDDLTDYDLNLCYRERTDNSRLIQSSFNQSLFDYGFRYFDQTIKYSTGLSTSDFLYKMTLMLSDHPGVLLDSNDNKINDIPTTVAKILSYTSINGHYSRLTTWNNRQEPISPLGNIANDPFVVDAFCDLVCERLKKYINNPESKNGKKIKEQLLWAKEFFSLNLNLTYKEGQNSLEIREPNQRESELLTRLSIDSREKTLSNRDEIISYILQQGKYQSRLNEDSWSLEKRNLKILKGELVLRGMSELDVEISKFIFRRMATNPDIAETYIESIDRILGK